MAGASVLTRRRDKSAQLRSEIDKLEQGILGDEQAAAQSHTLARQRETLLEELAADEASGKLSAAQVDERLEAIEREASAHLRNAEARQRAAAVRRRELEERRAELDAVEAAAAFEEHFAELKHCAGKRKAAERALVDAIAGLAQAIELTEASVAAEEAARELLEDLRPEGETRTVDVEDGPDWPDVDELVAALEAGPRKPVADAEAAADRRRREESRRRNEEITSIIRQFGSRSPSYYRHIQRFPEEFQDACNAAFARAEGEAQRRRASRTDLIERGEDGFPVDGRFVRVEV